ncbi:MAG: hypothetical protein IJT51_01355, partial [Bacteroidales bacterium]|nr:hypothetical protein [Bacteroidales bacterium]
MKQFYQRILLFSVVILLSLFNIMAQTVTNSYSYVWHYDSIYNQQNGSQNFPYTGSVQTFIVPTTGTYTLEVWGAQGGYKSNSSAAGKGGYSKGTISLNQNILLNIYVGGQGSAASSNGTSVNGGYNGGGGAKASNWGRASGGGGSDIRIGSTSLYARVIVAGGGGGSTGTADNMTTEYTTAAAHGGGTSGVSVGEISGTSQGTGYGGTQTGGGANSNSLSGANGTFGQGGNAGNNTCSGGGGGWYGGGAGSGPGGGSGYVYTSSTAGNYPSGCLLNSSYYLTNASTHAGNTTFASTTGGTETGHSGNGYAKISYSYNVFDHIDSTLQHTTVTTTIHDTICSNYTYSSFNFNLEGDTMSVGNHTYTQEYLISSVKDSIVVLNIYVEPALPAIIYQDSVCAGTQYYMNHGFTINLRDSVAGTYTYTRYEGSGHCILTYELQLKIRNQNYIHYYDTICQSENYLDPKGYGFEKLTYSYPSGEYIFKRPEIADGCIDTILLHLHINAIDTIKHTQYICANSSYSGYGFVNLSDTGVYIGTIPSANGCGDVVILTLKHNPVYNIVIRDTIRHGVIYTQHDYVVRTMDSTAGTYNYVKNLHTVSGCDSVVTLELCILPPISHTYYDTICHGTSYFRYGFSIPTDTATENTEYFYTATYYASDGADSTHNLYLYINKVAQ